MARKTDSYSSNDRGFDDYIGIVLFAVAFILLVAQLSYDRHDLDSVVAPANHHATNFIGPVGAQLAHASFFVLGLAAYLVPVFLFLFGASHLPGVLRFFGLQKLDDATAHLRERWRSQTIWSALVLFGGAGLLYLIDYPHLRETVSFCTRTRNAISAPSLGGMLGYMTVEYGFHLLGVTGAAVVFLTLMLIGALTLTNFQLGYWILALWERRQLVKGDQAAGPDEIALARQARDLEKQKRKLEEQTAKQAAKPATAAALAALDPEKAPSGLGADLQPVPEPQVRDLSFPQPKPAGNFRKTTLPEKGKQPEVGKSREPMFDEAEVIPVKEIAAATTADILGRAPEPALAAQVAESEKFAADSATEPSKTDVEQKPEPVINITGLTPPPRPKYQIKKPKPVTVASVPMIGNYQLPSMDFLQHPDMTVKATESKEELMANARLMQQTLAQFDIEVALGDITKGPTITRYELHPAPGVKMEKILSLNNNLAAALKAERINILAPVPGKSSVGVEVPNAVKTKVIMRDLLESDEWRNTKARIPLALGKDVYGHPIIADLGDMPHLLIAGSTGSGKSVCINSIIASLLYRFTPDQLRFVMIDPKVVELQQYNVLPHLVVPVVNDPKKVILALRWVVQEMEKRYKIFAQVGVRNIKSFNERPKNKPLPQQEPELPLLAKKEKVEPGADGFAVEVDEQIAVPREEEIVIPEKLSYIVVIIDELADLMLVAPADVEMAIARITQMARAAGIHCIVATQRPSVDVITGVIKSNIPARIAFQVAAAVDSRTILDNKGADKLLGKGDMLYLPPGSAKLIRVQGALITDQEIQSCVDFIALQGKPSYEAEIHKQLSKPVNTFGGESGIDEDEEIIQQCIEVIRSEQKASVSLLQRRLKLGYGRAARIMDELENRGIVGESKGAEPRDILIDLDGEGHDGGGQSAV
ncbi:MAG: hypothetical protein RLZZ350_1472 [Verrucomicrobiota bacterium]